MNKRNTGAESRTWTPSEIVVALIALACALLLYGAVPFLMLPTLGQAVWTMGFAESFANGHLLDFYAHDFGIPKPAAMAFGLAGAWPASLLVRLGWHAADAYSGMAAFWLGLAMYFAYRIARGLGATRLHSVVGSTAWISTPIVWAPAG